MLKRLFSGMTDPGLLRSSNQDDFYMDPAGRFFIVADGMGGHAGGQEASRLATLTIREHLEQEWDSDAPTKHLLQRALLLANRAILEDQSDHPERGDMGTTVVVMSFREHLGPLVCPCGGLSPLSTAGTQTATNHRRSHLDCPRR